MRVPGRTVMDRRGHERYERLEAARCPPHPPDRMVWQPGDALTFDRQVCGRCFTTLAVRPHVAHPHGAGSSQ